MYIAILKIYYRLSNLYALKKYTYPIGYKIQYIFWGMPFFPFLLFFVFTLHISLAFKIKILVSAFDFWPDKQFTFFVSEYKKV